MPRRTRHVALALGSLVAVLCLAGCSGDSGGSGGSDEPEAGTAGTSAGPGAEPAASDPAAAEGGAGEPGTADGAAGDPGEVGSPGGAGGDTSGGSASGGSGSGDGGAGSGGGGTSAGAPGGPAAGPAVDDPRSPYVTAAAAVATRSRDQVLQLHAMSVATAPSADFPKDQVAGMGALIVRDLDAQIETATMAVPPAGTPAADLVAVLRSYRSLAATVGEWQAGSGLLPDGYFAKLRAADGRWRAALEDLGALTGADLLENLPALAMP